MSDNDTLGLTWLRSIFPERKSHARADERSWFIDSPCGGGLFYGGLISRYECRTWLRSQVFYSFPNSAVLRGTGDGI